MAERKQYRREEIACALRLAPVTVNDRLHVAGELVGRCRATLELLESGGIGLMHARAVVEAVDGLPDAVAVAVQARVLPGAAGLTPSLLRVALRRAVLAADPGGGDERHAVAVAGRRVEARALPEGMGSIWALLPADGVQAVMTALNAAAGRPSHTPDPPDTDPPNTAPPDTDPPNTGEPSTDDRGVDQRGVDQRGVDQRRADAFVALLTGQEVSSVQSWHGRRPAVQISVALSSLLGLDGQPGELEGYGPIPPAMTRRIAADPSGTWRRILTDPRGQLLDYGRRTHRPPAELCGFVIARDRTCRFPGCRQQARRCDLDHQLDWTQGGTTSQDNLACLCPRHHQLKHEAGWSVHGDPAEHLLWVTPTGHHYLDPPGRYPIDQTAWPDVRTADTLHALEPEGGSAPAEPDVGSAPAEPEVGAAPAEPEVGAASAEPDVGATPTDSDLDPPPF